MERIDKITIPRTFGSAKRLLGFQALEKLSTVYYPFISLFTCKKRLGNKEKAIRGKKRKPGKINFLIMSPS
jgi:hypothetical protein